MPKGKLAGERCIQLDDSNLCKLFNHPERPKVCNEFKAQSDTCGATSEQAILNISLLEQATS